MDPVTSYGKSALPVPEILRPDKVIFPFPLSQLGASTTDF